MTRRDDHLDAMLRYLGTAYYESLHGRAASYDVTRMLDAVEEHLKEGATRAETAPQPGRPLTHQADGPRRSWARRVTDVMTTSVVTVDPTTPYQEIVRLLTEHKIGGVPVLMTSREVAGVITESDLLAEEDTTARQARLNAASPGRWHIHRPELASLTARALMTTPAITTHPNATIPGAARLMNTHRIGRLPVIDSQGKLAGIVSRRDLLSVFLRPDDDIAYDVQRMLDKLLLIGSENVTVTVHNGVVTLGGCIEPTPQRRDLIALALRLTWNVDGVVDVLNTLGDAPGPKTP